MVYVGGLINSQSSPHTGKERLCLVIGTGETIFGRQVREMQTWGGALINLVGATR